MFIHADLPLSDLLDRYADETSRFLEMDGIRVHYRDEGNKTGPVVIFLHGLLSSLHTWDEWVNTFKAHFRVVRLDLPGFGLTGPSLSSDAYSSQYYISFLHQFLDHLKIKKCSLVGNSLGGWIAWRFAADYHQRTEKLILLNAAGYELGRPPLLVRIARLPLMGTLLKNVTPQWLVSTMVKTVYGNSPTIRAKINERYRDLALRAGNRRAFLQMVKGKIVEDPELIRTIRAPTLILWGENDRWIKVRNAYRFKRDIPHATVKVYPGMGHVPMEEFPEVTSLEAFKFLRA